MSGKQNQYNIGLDKTPANYVPLTPLSFLARSAAVYPDHVSTVYEGRSFTWSQTYARCRRFASYLAGRGIGTGDTVAAMLPNIPAMNEAHFAVPMAGAVLNALNIRLDAPSIAFQLDHGGARIILVDPEFTGVISEALALMKGPKPFVIDVDDAAFPGGKRIGEIEYEDALSQGDPSFIARLPEDEWDAIALSYTSGTTGNPKGVVTHHRGAYLNAVSNILAGNLGQHPSYLWTLPMFHCNGWCFPWTLAAMGGTSVCLRRVEAKAALDAAQAQMDSLEAQVREQEVQLHYYKVTAPRAGIVGDIPVRVGDRVTTVTQLTTVDQPGTLEAYVYVPIERSAQLKMNLPVQIVDSVGKVLSETRISFISPQVDNTTQTVLVKARIANGNDALRQSQFIRARVIWGTHQSPEVPILAVSRLAGQYFAFVAEPQSGGQYVAKQKALTIGQTVGNDFEVRDGIKPGDKVIVSGTQFLVDGMPVIPQS